jgi:G:T-mismatch repair DNA endonuclease (very short patch repair protein)
VVDLFVGRKVEKEVVRPRKEVATVKRENVRWDQVWDCNLGDKMVRSFSWDSRCHVE